MRATGLSCLRGSYAQANALKALFGLFPVALALNNTPVGSLLSGPC